MNTLGLIIMIVYLINIFENMHEEEIRQREKDNVL